MSSFSTIILAPFIIAFVVFVGRFYGREGARSMRSPSFLLAICTVASAFSYLVLRVIDSLPSYGTIGYGIGGVVLLATAIGRLFMI
jgi:hypothetical protein